MTESQIYFVAEWLALNKEAVRDELLEHYTKALTLTKEHAIDYIKDTLFYTFSANHPSFTEEEIEAAFADERVSVVISRYYVKEFYYEH